MTLSITRDTGKAAVSVHLKEAAPSQLARFLDSLNSVKAYFANFRGKKFRKVRIFD